MLNKRFTQLKVADINLSVNIILNEIGNALQQGRKAEFREFGVFTAHIKPARTARNPKTGAILIMPEKIVPHFKSSALLNRRLNNVTHELDFNFKSLTLK